MRTNTSSTVHRLGAVNFILATRIWHVPPRQPLQLLAKVSTDLNIPHFITPVYAEEAAIQCKKWRRNFERKLSFFRVTPQHDKLEALLIYGGEDIDELVDNLLQLPDEQVTVDANEQVNDFHRAIANLDNHFTSMLNKDSANSVFEKLTQGDLTMAKYYAALKK